MTTYILSYYTPKGLKHVEIVAANEREARIKGRDYGKIHAGPTKKIELPDKIVRPDNI